MNATRVNLLAAALAVFAFAVPGRAAAEALVLAVAQSSPITDLSSADLRRVFLSESVARNGKPIVPLNLPTSSDLRRSFDQIVLGMSPPDAARFWNERKIRGETGSPKEVPSTGKGQLMAAKFPEVLIYLPARELSSKLRVVTIDGKKPGDPGYLLAAP